MSNKANRIWLSSPTKHGLEMGIYDRDIPYKLDVHCGGENINEAERLACKKICRYTVELSAETVALHMAAKLAGVRPGIRYSVRI